MVRPRFLNLPQEKRQGIIEAAAEEFAKFGFEGASYNRIIEACGLSKGAMYYYFDDKEDLFLTVVRHVQQETLIVLGEVPDADTPEEFWAMFRELGMRKLDFQFRSPRMAAITRALMQLMSQEATRKMLEKVFAEGYEYLSRMIEVGKKAGALRSDMSTEFLVRLYTSIGESYAIMLGKHPEAMQEDAIEGVCDAFIDVFKRAVEPAEGLIPWPLTMGGLDSNDNKDQ